MLISPIMGPIMGMGLGVGINDFELFKRSFRSFFTATVFSVLTATFYFLVTPIAEAQSELADHIRRVHRSLRRTGGYHCPEQRQPAVGQRHSGSGHRYGTYATYLYHRVRHRDG